MGETGLGLIERDFGCGTERKFGPVRRVFFAFFVAGRSLLVRMKVSIGLCYRSKDR
jgi:hypothetical protein